ncbi:hypothetical protein D3C81_1774200 [compost metagenome]
MFDIRRQRQAAVRFDQLEDIVRELQFVKFTGALADDHVESIGQANTHANRWRLGSTDLCVYIALVNHALDQHLDFAAGFLDAKEARLQHARVIEYQQIARCQQANNIGKVAISHLAGTDLQQARGAAFGQRGLRNQILRQFEIEIGK